MSFDRHLSLKHNYVDINRVPSRQAIETLM
jgi:hypothetical protein